MALMGGGGGGAQSVVRAELLTTLRMYERQAADDGAAELRVHERAQLETLREEVPRPLSRRPPAPP